MQSIEQPLYVAPGLVARLPIVRTNVCSVKSYFAGPRLVRGFASLRLPRLAQQLAALRYQAANSQTNITSSQLQLVFPIMNNFIADPTEILVSSIISKAQPDVKTYVFSFIPTLTKKAAALQEAVLKEVPDLRHVVTRELAESCDEVEVVFETIQPISIEALKQRQMDARALAKRHKAELWNVRVAGNFTSRQSDAPRGVNLRMRTEFLDDVLVLRIALLPWVLHWSDYSINMTGAPSCPAQIDNMDRNVEFELAGCAPSLDHLRWYINQIADMHVAAETLHYADRYTGRRLPYHLLEKMMPPVEVIENMLTVATEATDWVRDQPNCPIRGLVTSLTNQLTYLKLMS